MIKLGPNNEFIYIIFGNKIYKVQKSRITLLNNMSLKPTVLQNIKPLTCFHSHTLKTRPTLRVL